MVVAGGNVMTTREVVGARTVEDVDTFGALLVGATVVDAPAAGAVVVVGFIGTSFGKVAVFGLAVGIVGNATFF